MPKSINICRLKNDIRLQSKAYKWSGSSVYVYVQNYMEKKRENSDIYNITILWIFANNEHKIDYYYFCFDDKKFSFENNNEPIRYDDEFVWFGFKLYSSTNKYSNWIMKNNFYAIK